MSQMMTTWGIASLCEDNDYGIMGQSSSIFYNLFSAMSVTGKGQSVISTAMTTFERFMGNTIKFRCVDECLVFINRICEEPEVKIEYNIVDRSEEEVIEKLLNECEEPTKLNRQIISKVIKNTNMSQHILNKLYYKNNFYEFIVNEEILAMFDMIANFDSLQFRNPNEIPEKLETDMENLWKAFEEFVLYDYITYNKIDILRYNPREVVLGVDTDSNFLYLGKYYEFLKEKLKFEEDDEVLYRLSNTLTAILAKVIAKAYARYTKNCNVPEEHRYLVAMKSEFLWRRVLFTKAKKNYASVAMLQEGKVLGNKLDVKGLAMKKSNVNKNTSAYLQDLLEHKILKTKEIDVPEVLTSLNELEVNIREKFLSGDTEYLTPASCKKQSAYKNPYTVSALRAAIAWNTAYPEKPIVLPDNFNIVKCKINTLNDMADLQNTNPDIYTRLKGGIFNDQALGRYGITYFAIPKSEEKIPEWLIPYIDIDTIINDNLTVFNPIVESLGLQILETTDGNFYSNILNI